MPIQVDYDKIFLISNISFALYCILSSLLFPPFNLIVTCENGYICTSHDDAHLHLSLLGFETFCGFCS